MTATNIEIIVSPKSLERQIKILDERILELQSEMNALEKKREACHTLLGIPLAPVGAVAAVETAPVKKATPRKKREAESEELEDEAIEAIDVSAASEESASAH